MKYAVAAFLMFCCGILASGQDGGNDIIYVPPTDLSTSYIGRALHLDFGTRSFVAFNNPRKLDVVAIDLGDGNIDFVEHRIDDGFNRWFKDQYLESVKATGGTRLRIVRFELLEIGEKKLKFRAFVSVFDDKYVELPGRSFTREVSFEKKDIVEFLFKASD